MNAKNVVLQSSFPIKFGIDMVLAALSAWGAYAMRFGFPIPILHRRSEIVYIALSIAVKLAVELFFKLYRQSWRNIGIRDLIQLFRAVVVLLLILATASFLLGTDYRISRSIPSIDALLTFICWGGVRLAARIFQEERLRSLRKGDDKRVLIIGAGEAGTMIAREMLRHPEAGLLPVGFLDDDPGKIGTTFVGYPVFGRVDLLAAVTKKMAVDEILIAIPSARGDVIRSILDAARDEEIPARIIPGVWEVISGKVSISSIRNVEVEDLLNRDPVQLDLDEIAGYIRDKRVLVTGAGGSIGSEIVRQILPFFPRHVVLLGRGENSLFQIQQELRTRSFSAFTVVVADVRNRERMSRVFDHFQPQVVFHAAAHKHVPLMEENPEEAVLNNVFGTKNLVDLSLSGGVEAFVNISTDKAVNPTSVMGASKRVAEMVVRNAAMKAAEGQVFVSVRFGNVLGSRGSVIPIFKEQIRRGGPVTVTHPDMTRYFMTIPEAAQLVLQAGGMKRNGSVFVLDMGEPVKIVDLARDLITLSGFVPGEDIEIVFTGMRQGEKLFEELLTAEEGTEASHFKKIFMARDNDLSEDFATLLVELRSTAEGENRDAIRTVLGRIVPQCTVCKGQEAL